MEHPASSQAVRCPQCGKLARLPAGVKVTTARCPHCKAVWKLSQGTGGHYQAPQSDEAKLQPEKGERPGMETPGVERAAYVAAAAKTLDAPSQPGSGTTPLWWFLVGGVFVFMVVLIAGLTVAVVLLLWQRPTTPPPAPAPSPQIVAPAEAPPPQMDPELDRRAAATVAYLDALQKATFSALGGPEILAQLAIGAGPDNVKQRLDAWERDVAALNPQDVDPLAIAYKKEFCDHFRAVMAALQGKDKIAAAVSASPDALLDTVAGATPDFAESFSAPQRFLFFLRTRSREVKDELESRYQRPMPILVLP